MRHRFDDVHIYVSDSSDPVVTITSLELASKSKLLHDIFSSLHICDGCPQPKSIILPDPDDDRESVISALRLVSHFKKSRLSIIKGRTYYLLICSLYKTLKPLFGRFG